MGNPELEYRDEARVAEILGMEADLRYRQEATLLRSVLFMWDDAWMAIDKFSAVEFRDEAFVDARNRALWRAMVVARANGVSSHSEDLVRAFLADSGIRKQFSDRLWGDHEQGFIRYLRALYQPDAPVLPNPVNVPPYLDAMVRAKQREEIRGLARHVAKGGSVEALQKALDGFSDGSGVKGGPTLVRGGKGLRAALAGWRDDAHPGESEGTRIPWHIFPRFDEGGGFIRDGDYAILAARPGRGKTSAAIQIAVTTAARFKRPVLYVSLEMPAVQIWQKAVLSEAGVDDPRGGPFDREAAEKVIRAKDWLEREVPLLVLDQPPPNLWRLKSYLSNLVQTERPILTVIDYLGLIQAKGEEYQRVTLISQHLRAWALANTPVLMVHQLNRASVTEGKRPRMPRQSDLRGSGQIEQDATHIILLHEAGGMDGDRDYDYEQDSNSIVPMVAMLSKVRQGRPGLGERLLFDRAKSRMLPHA